MAGKKGKKKETGGEKKGGERKEKRVVINTKAKKKRAVARAVLRAPGKGMIRINGVPWYLFHNNKYLRMKLEEPLLLSGDVWKNVDIDVNVHGGGVMGQVVAARGAIAKALAIYGGEEVKRKFLEYDRMLLVDDTRRTEPKKPLGRKARAKKQTSYR